MSSHERPQGPGRYNVIAPPHARDELRATHRDGNPLPALPDPDEPLAFRKPIRGTTPAQVQRQLEAKMKVLAAMVAKHKAVTP